MWYSRETIKIRLNDCKIEIQEGSRLTQIYKKVALKRCSCDVCDYIISMFLFTSRNYRQHCQPDEHFHVVLLQRNTSITNTLVHECTLHVLGGYCHHIGLASSVKRPTPSIESFHCLGYNAKFWSDQQVPYHDYNAGLRGIGNRSLL